jgi:hypothetical protein
MRYVIFAVAGVLALVNWLNSPSGLETKRNLLESRDNATGYMPVE